MTERKPLEPVAWMHRAELDIIEHGGVPEIHGTRLYNGDVAMFTADQIREAVERVKMEERCIVDPEPFEGDFGDGWNAALSALLRELGMEDR